MQAYDKRWVDEFNKEKNILQEILIGFSPVIEHVGSTSVPGMMAKPIIDIAVGVKDVETQKNIGRVLGENGYIVKDKIKADGYIFAGRENGKDILSHHIHIEIVGERRWQEHILFKQHLIDNPAFAKEYGELKKSLAIKFADDRESYKNAKSEYIRPIIYQLLVAEDL